MANLAKAISSAALTAIALKFYPNYGDALNRWCAYGDRSVSAYVPPNLLVRQDSFEELAKVILDFGFWILDSKF